MKRNVKLQLHIVESHMKIIGTIKAKNLCISHVAQILGVLEAPIYLNVFQP